ncbi:META domain-containing protein [Streptomyces sp. NPDC018007]|uniref:META domain-containing protein n=1 Tax=unclassified Streptomyces TaxID=2593676 RepID=UPI0037A7A16D|nr:META domain-containing protein [Streptomyces sp. NBC_01178]
MRTQRMTLSVSVLALLALAACGTEPGPGSGGGDTVQSDVPVTGVAWSVDSVTVDGKTTGAPAGARMEFDPKGRATADFGCNKIGVDARVKGDRITLGKPVTTQMVCGEDIEKFEKAAIDAMGGELTAKLSGEKLTLTGEGGATMELSEEKPADLVGTRWTVTTLLDGEAATTVPADLPRERAPHLTFTENGTVRGNAGCNSFGGKAAVKGSTITFDRIVSTRKMCPQAEMEREKAVLAALRGPATYTIEGSELTLTGDGGKGIGATAAPAGSGSQHG